MKQLLTVFLVLFFASCKHDPTEMPAPVIATGYPADIERIVTTTCAVEGCHNTASKDASSGLDMSTWDAMFEGTNNGAINIPFRPDFSTLLYFTNTDSTKGLVSYPTMPLSYSTLSDQDYNTLKQWIANGSPDVNGKIKFADNPQRHKFYVTNQGCDVVSVFDSEKRVVMRMIDVGVNPGANPPESPHNLKFTPDGKYWVVVFLASDIVQVFDAATDQLVSTIPIGNGQSGQWNTVIIASDSKHAYAADYAGRRIATIDLVNFTSQTSPAFPYNFHGQALNATNDTLYVTCQDISKILKIPLASPVDYEEIDLVQGNSAGPNQLQPHEIAFNGDYTKYFVTCQNSNVNQVRVYNAADNTLLKVIPVGIAPVEIAYSAGRHLFFVTNMEDNSFPGMRGSVSVIDEITMTELQKIKVGWQPHGIAVDELTGRVYVANRNYSGGPAPHHATACNGNNGYLSIINLNTLTTDLSFRPEVSVDPYSIVVRP